MNATLEIATRVRVRRTIAARRRGLAGLAGRVVAREPGTHCVTVRFDDKGGPQPDTTFYFSHLEVIIDS